MYELTLTRRHIQQEMERQGVSVDASKLTDINLLKRQVLKRCIYGVDLNPMAVELAKVSLWLDCFTLGAPLSFLDHHMKAGNSLIGGSVGEVQDALSRDLFGNQFAGLLSATSLMQQVGKLSDITVEQVAVSRTTYRQASDALAPFKRLLDTWISEYFGNKGAQRTASLYAGAIVADDHRRTNPVDREAIQAAQKLAITKRFFHWELEFPEVFYDETSRKESGGFDAVIGNPPYGRYDMLDEGSKAFIRFSKLCFGSADLAEAFMDKACRLSHTNKVGFVVPKVFTYVTNWDNIRELLAKKGVLFIADVSEAFEDVLYEQVIYGTGHLPYTNETIICRVTNEAIEQTHVLPSSSLNKAFFPLYLNDLSFLTWQKIQTSSVYLGQVYDYWYGKGGAVPKLTTKPSEYKVVQGRDIARYSEHEEAKIYLPTNEITLAEKRFAERSKLIIQDIVAHVTKPYPRIILMSTLDKEQRIALNTVTCCAIKQSSQYSLGFLLAILNSLLTSWYVYNFIYNRAVRTMHFMPGYVDRTPIRRINFTTAPKEREQILYQLKNQYEAGNIADILETVRACIPLAFERQPAIVHEKSDVVHDLLAFLAEEMVRLNKDKQAMQAEFLGWLTSTIKVQPGKEDKTGLEVLNGKVRLLDFPGDYQKGEAALTPQELLDILQKNRSKLGVRLSDTSLPDVITSRYSTALSQALPLKEKLAATDRLIDEIVYRLYGLTEDEIAIVKGAK